MALIDQLRYQKRPTGSQRTGAVVGTFIGMATGQIKPHGEGGMMGLNAPMSYSFGFSVMIVLAIVLFTFHS